MRGDRRDVIGDAIPFVAGQHQSPLFQGEIDRRTRVVRRAPIRARRPVEPRLEVRRADRTSSNILSSQCSRTSELPTFGAFRQIANLDLDTDSRCTSRKSSFPSQRPSISPRSLAAFPHDSWCRAEGDINCGREHLSYTYDSADVATDASNAGPRLSIGARKMSDTNEPNRNLRVAVMRDDLV
jgi:hypothetical protein